jgi:hypothetical protein
MAKRVYPGALCRIIGSANGPKGVSVGRTCRAKFLYTDRPPHSLWGEIWRVTSADGKEFVSEHGGIGMEVDCAEDWLEIIDEDPTASSRTTQKELENV